VKQKSTKQIIAEEKKKHNETKNQKDYAHTTIRKQNNTQNVNKAKQL
jgi:hypothetical protein